MDEKIVKQTSKKIYRKVCILKFEVVPWPGWILHCFPCSWHTRSLHEERNHHPSLPLLRQCPRPPCNVEESSYHDCPLVSSFQHFWQISSTPGVVGLTWWHHHDVNCFRHPCGSCPLGLLVTCNCNFPGTLKPLKLTTAASALNISKSVLMPPASTGIPNKLSCRLALKACWTWASSRHP